MEKSAVDLLRDVALAVLEWAYSLEAVEELPAAVAEEEGAFLPEGIQRGFPHENLRRWGCYFFALLRWAQELGYRRGIADVQIVALFAEAQRQMMPNPTPGDGRGARIPIVTNTAFVNDPVRLLNFLAGKTVVRRVSLWTNDPNHSPPREDMFIRRVAHSTHGKHFVLSIRGKEWDSLPIDGRAPAGFRALA